MFPHRLIAGTGMVLLAAVWAAGWFTPPDPYADTESPLLLMVLTAATLAAWNLLACVVAVGFFHAAGLHPGKTFRAFRLGSLRLEIMGVIFLFPVPLMAQVLGGSALGRSLALFITAMSIAAVMFGRARMRLVESHLGELARRDEQAFEPAPSLAPWEESS